jgi:hypothetical protein
MACVAAAVAVAAIWVKSAGAGLGEWCVRYLGVVEILGMVSISSLLCERGDVWRITVGRIACRVAGAFKHARDMSSVDFC